MALVPTKSSINHLNSHYYEETISYYGYASTFNLFC